MNARLIAVTVLALCVAPALAWAGWRSGDPAKWLQMPDPNGWDVSVTAVEVLADDFPCTETGWITDIHFWGSWKSDDVGTIDRIVLSIHEDVPAGQDPDHPYSHPGNTVWSLDFDPATYAGFAMQEWGTGQQGWYHPGTGQYSPDEHSGIYQVDVLLSEKDWFPQKGTAAEPTVYWLSMMVHVVDAETEFGWKTSLDHWSDNAVSGIWFGPSHGPPAWSQDLHIPTTGATLDLAFVITGIPIPEPEIIALSGLGLLALLRRRK